MERFKLNGGWIIAFVLVLFIMFSDKLASMIASQVAVLYSTQLKSWQDAQDQKLVGIYNNIDARLKTIEGSASKETPSKKGG